MSNFFDQLSGGSTYSEGAYSEEKKAKKGKKRLKKRLKELEKKNNKKLRKKINKCKRRQSDIEARLDRLERNRHE